MSKTSIIQRKVVVDEPAKVDDFEGKGHLRTARQLANTVLEFDDKDRAIGLEGDWGAGKSTVVRLASEELSKVKNRNFRFFTFDMWSNQTSPFRRTFLEKLIDWAKREYNNDRSRVDKLDELLDRVRDRTVTTTSNSFRRLDWFGVLFILFGPMLPLAFAWLSPLSINPVRGSALSFTVFGFCVPVWSVAIILVFFLYGAFLVRVLKRSKAEKISFAKALSMSASLFTKQQENETTTQNIREEDPNEYEFENTFLDTLQVIQKNDDRIVIVFDNIDRLPKDCISNAWADIRAVFSGDPTSPNEGDRACTAIVPYDRAHVFDAISVGGQNGSSERDLFRKTFDEIFRVSPPVASNVSKHVEATLRKGLPNFDDKDAIYNVTKIFQRSTLTQDRPVTPRQVISFVNEISGIFAQWEGKIPLDTIAIYQVFRDEIEQKPQLLTEFSDKLAPYLVNSRDNDLNRHLAAIAYNVDPQLAYQILLEGPVSTALVDKESDRIQSLSGAPGFPQVLVDIVEAQASNWAKEAAKTYARVAKNLKSVSLDSQTSSHVLALYLNGLDDLIFTKIENAEDIQDLRAVIELCPNDLRSSVSLRLANWLKKCLAAKEATFEDGKTWVRSLGALIKDIDNNVEPFTDQLLSRLHLPRNLQFILGVAYDCDEIDVPFSKFKHNFSSRSFLEPLKTFITDDPFAFHYIFDQLKPAKSLNTSDLLELLEHQRNHLATQSLAGAEDSFACRAENFIAIYGTVAGEKKATEILGSLSDNGTLAWHANAAQQSDDAHTALAATMWLTLQHLKTEAFAVGGNTNQAPFGNLFPARQWLYKILTGSAELPVEVIDQLATHVIDQEMVPFWIDLAAHPSPAQEIYCAVVKRLGEKSDLYTLPLETLTGHYELIRNQFGDGIDQALKNTGEIIRDEEINELELTSIPIALLRDTINRAESGWRCFHSTVEKMLAEITDEDWKTILVSDNIILKVLSTETEYRDFTLPAHKFQEPLTDVMVELMSGQVQIGNRPHFSSTILDSIPPKVRPAMPKAIADRMGGLSITREAFGYLEANFSDLIDKVFSNSSDNAKVRNFATPAIASATDRGVKFVEKHSKSLKASLANVDDEQRGHFIELVESVRSDIDPQLIQNLADQLGVNLAPLDTDPSNADEHET